MNSPDIIYGHTPDGRRVVIPRAEHAGQHCMLQGKSGSRKTLLFTGLAEQFLEPYRLDGVLRRDTVVIIDLGGDQFFYNRIAQRSKDLGLVLKTFSLNPLHDGCHFEPLQSCGRLTHSTGRMASLVTSGLNLLYGSEGYGVGYFSRLNLATIGEALETITLRGNTTPSLHDLATELRKMARSLRSSKDANEALFALNQLLWYPQLSTSSDADENIDIGLALEQGNIVLYFYLPTIHEPLAARAVATLAAWSVIVEAVHRNENGLATRTVHLFEDEFAQIAGGKSFEDMLVQSRKFDVRLVLAYQSRQQLRMPQGDIGYIVRDNCPIKVYFTLDTADSGDYRDLQGYSKDVPKVLGGQSFHGLSSSTSTHEIREPKLERNEIIDVSNQGGHAYFVYDSGKGHQEPLHIVCKPPTTREEHRRLANTPLPSRNGQSTKPAAQPPAAPPPQPPMVPATASPQHTEADERSEKIRQLIAAKRQAEQWAA